ncbi:MAG TPA: sulfatase-like hydrolase/transferase [Polyangiaceae bacterium]|nr:sulfatase-like hydrolase/transferase [Polyangiaceae bacterium]
MFRQSRCFALLALLALSCSRKAEPEPKPVVADAPSATAQPSASVAAAVTPKKPEPVRPYNVVLIMIDALRADMPWTGYPREIAPWLTAFEKRVASYHRAYSLSSYTAKSVLPALTGHYPSAMARDGYFFTKWMPENEVITERAQKAGHRTLAGHGHGYFLPGMGLDQGFDDYRLLKGTFLDNTGVHDVNSDRLNKLGKEQLSDPKNIGQEGNKRFFAYYHYLDPHYSYSKHPGHPDFGNKARDVYDNEVHFTDQWVGDFVDWLLEQPFGKQTAVIITADHGEGFGEHNHYRHAYEIWESLVRVPLLIYVPGATPTRITTPRSHIDLAPTIADLMGIPPDPTWPGKSLVPEIFGEEPTARPVIAELPRADLMDRRRALIDGDYKLIAFGDDQSYQLYKVSEDFKEERDLVKTEPERFEAMKKRYLEVSATIPNVKITGGAPLKGAPAGRGW